MGARAVRAPHRLPARGPRVVARHDQRAGPPRAGRPPGIAATTIYHGFAERPCPEQRAAVRRRIRMDGGPLVLQPTRAIARKRVDVGLALTAAIGGTYWLTGPAEDGYQPDLDALLSGGGSPTGGGCRSACRWPARTPRATWSPCRPRGRGSGCR